MKREVISKSNPHVLAVRAENMEAHMSAASWSRQNTFCTKCEVCKYIQAIGKDDPRPSDEAVGHQIRE